MNTEKIIDEIYKMYPMCRVEIEVNEGPSEICITVRFYRHGDCLEFVQYIGVNVQDRFSEDFATALVDLVTSRIKEELDSYGRKGQVR